MKAWAAAADRNSVSLPDGGKEKYSGWTYGEE